MPRHRGGRPRIRVPTYSLCPLLPKFFRVLRSILVFFSFRWNRFSAEPGAAPLWNSCSAKTYAESSTLLLSITVWRQYCAARSNCGARCIRWKDPPIPARHWKQHLRPSDRFAQRATTSRKGAALARRLQHPFRGEKRRRLPLFSLFRFFFSLFVSYQQGGLPP